MSLSTYKKQFRVIIALAALVVLIGGAAVAAYLVRYSATSDRICAKCHAELIELWKRSEGCPAQKTKCYQCHSRGFELAPKGWNIIKHGRDQLAPSEYLADDALTSQRCLDCHQNILNLDYKPIKRIIKFNHRIHNGEGLNCMDCHRSAGHEYMTGGSNRPSVSECLDCHLREFEGPPKNWKCLNCHEIMLVPGKQWE